MKRLTLKINHIIFWWYYKRVPLFFHRWTILKSIRLLVSNYEHQIVITEGLEGVIRNASKREREMTAQISNLQLKINRVPQSQIDPFNEMFGTNLKGISREEKDN